jgi:hypothetical protein
MVANLFYATNFMVCQDQSFELSLGFNRTPELEDVIINNAI